MREQSEQGRASKQVSGASERANGQANGLVFQSIFLVALAQSATAVIQREIFHFKEGKKREKKKRKK